MLNLIDGDHGHSEPFLSPHSIANISKAAFLTELSSNVVTDFSTFSRLETLTVYQIPFYAAPTLDFVSSSTLKTLMLSSGTTVDLPSLRRFTSLESLEIRFRDVPPGSLDGLSNLRHLILQNV